MDTLLAREGLQTILSPNHPVSSGVIGSTWFNAKRTSQASNDGQLQGVELAGDFTVSRQGLNLDGTGHNGENKELECKGAG